MLYIEVHTFLPIVVSYIDLAANVQYRAVMVIKVTITSVWHEVILHRLVIFSSFKHFYLFIRHCRRCFYGCP